MKCTMNSDGFSVEGQISLSSKNKLFTIKGGYQNQFVVGGELDRRVEKQTFDRYLTIVMRDLAKDWIKYEKKVVQPLQAQIDAAETELEKLAKSPKRGALTQEYEKRQKTLQTECNRLIADTMTPALKEAGGKAHDAAMNVLAKESSSVRKSKKAIAFSFGKTTTTLAIGVTASVFAALTAATGGAAAVVMTAVAICLKSVAALVSTVRTMQALRRDMKGNFKLYKSAVDALDKQVSETQKVSRALTSKWDMVSIRHAEIAAHIEKLESQIPTVANFDKKTAKLADLQKKLKADAKTLEKYASLNPAEIEEAFQKIKSILQGISVFKEMETAGGTIDSVAEFFDTTAAAMETILVAVESG